MSSRHLTSSQMGAIAESGDFDDVVRAHVAECAKCRARLESLLDVYRSIGSPLSGPETDSPRLMEARFHMFRQPAQTAESAHPDEASILAFLSEILPSHEASRIEAHLSRCSRCAERAKHLRGYAPEAAALPRLSLQYQASTKLAGRRQRAEPQHARVVLRRVPEREALWLEPLAAGPSAIADARFSSGWLASVGSWFRERRDPARPDQATFEAGGESIHLRGAVLPSGARLDVEVAPHGHDPSGIRVELRSPSGRTASARTGADGRVTLPLEEGASLLIVAAPQSWEIEVLFEAL